MTELSWEKNESVNFANWTGQLFWRQEEATLSYPTKVARLDIELQSRSKETAPSFVLKQPAEYHFSPYQYISTCMVWTNFSAQTKSLEKKWVQTRITEIS